MDFCLRWRGISNEALARVPGMIEQRLENLHSLWGGELKKWVCAEPLGSSDSQARYLRSPAIAGTLKGSRALLRSPRLRTSRWTVRTLLRADAQRFKV
jgi:hypothetical protein